MSSDPSENRELCSNGQYLEKELKDTCSELQTTDSPETPTEGHT